MWMPHSRTSSNVTGADGADNDNGIEVPVSLSFAVDVAGSIARGFVSVIHGRYTCSIGQHHRGLFHPIVFGYSRTEGDQVGICQGSSRRSCKIFHSGW